MTDPTIDLEPHDEAILLEFEEEVRQAPEPEAVREEFCRKHPKLEPYAREIVEITRLLGAAPCWQLPDASNGSEGDVASHPERLGPYKVVRPIGAGEWESFMRPWNRR